MTVTIIFVFAIVLLVSGLLFYFPEYAAGFMGFKMREGSTTTFNHLKNIGKKLLFLGLLLAVIGFAILLI